MQVPALLRISEHNGLTLNGVGNGTKIENIYVLESADDAIEFFGGTVNVTCWLLIRTTICSTLHKVVVVH